MMAVFKILDKLRSFRRMVSIPRRVNLHFQPFLPYMNLAPKNSYWTGIWPSNLTSRRDFAKKRGGMITMRAGGA